MASILNDTKINYERVHVLNQDYDGHVGPDGRSDGCGFHALRNAIIGLGFRHNKALREKLLKDSERFELFYQECAKNIQKENKGGNDITLDAQRKILNRFETGKFSKDKDKDKDLFQGFEKIQKEQINLPLISVGQTWLHDIGEGMKGNFFIQGQSGNLAILSNLMKIANLINKPIAFHHAFVIGVDERHWVTIILHQNEQGKRSWEGMDSLYNDNGKSLKLLFGILKNTIKKDFNKNLKKIYQDSTEYMRIEYKKVFDKNGKLSKDKIPYTIPNSGQKIGFYTPTEYLLESTVAGNNLPQLIDMFQFINDNNLYDNKEFQDEIKELSCFVQFYAQHLEANHPMKTMFQAMLAAISANVNLNPNSNLYTQSGPDQKQNNEGANQKPKSPVLQSVALSQEQATVQKQCYALRDYVQKHFAEINANQVVGKILEKWLENADKGYELFLLKLGREKVQKDHMELLNDFLSLTPLLGKKDNAKVALQIVEELLSKAKVQSSRTNSIS